MQEASMVALLLRSVCNVLHCMIVGIPLSFIHLVPFCRTSAPILVSLAATVFGVISAWRRCAK